MPRGRRNVAASSPTTKSASARRPEAGPGPASSASIRSQSAPGTVSIPASFASCANGRIERERQRGDGPDRGRDERPRQAGGEPPHEADEPQRHEVEPVAVVEPVVAPRRAREGGDDEQPRDVGRGEQAHERGRRARAGPPGAPELPEHDRRDGDRHDHEVDGEVTEVVDEPLADRERVVATPELPVRAERVRGRAAGGEPRDERERAEHDRQRRGPEPHEVGARPRPRRGCEQPETCERRRPR